LPGKAKALCARDPNFFKENQREQPQHGADRTCCAAPSPAGFARGRLLRRNRADSRDQLRHVRNAAPNPPTQDAR
jgi:hypothetical protein